MPQIKTAPHLAVVRDKNQWCRAMGGKRGIHGGKHQPRRRAETAALQGGDMRQIRNALR